MCDQHFEGGYWLTVWEGKTEWIGLAKRTPFCNGHPMNEPGEIWFEFGPTKDIALAAIKASLAPVN